MTQDGRWIDSLPERIVRGLNHLRNANNIFEKIPSYAALEARIAGEALLKDILYGDTKNTKKNPTYKFLRETARAQNLISDIIFMRLEIVGDIANYTSPLKIFDYMITGKLIICSNLKVLKEVLRDDVNSILIDKKQNQSNWLKEIKKIKADLKRFNRLRFNAYKFANEKNFIWRAKNLMSSI